MYKIMTFMTICFIFVTHLSVIVINFFNFNEMEISVYANVADI